MTRRYHPTLRRMWMRHRHWLVDTYLVVMTTTAVVLIIVRGW